MRALVLGGASWNTMVYLDELPSGGPQTIHDSESHETVGSTGAGKSFALAALGVETVLHAALGNDTEGDRIRQACTLRGVRLIAEPDPQGTPRHLNLMDKHGGRLSIFLNAGGSEFAVNKDALRIEIAKADIIFLNIVPSSVPVLELLKDAKAPIWVDLHDWDGENPWHKQFIEYADVVQLSNEAVGNNAQAITVDLLSGRAEMVVLTKGADGAVLTDHSGARTHIPPHPVSSVVDTNGAGDTFMVGVWLGLMRGLTLEEAGNFAAGIAAQTVAQSELAPHSFQ